MSAPFDTLKLARRFEAAGIEHKQAGDMAEAIAEATSAADLVTKTDLTTAIKDLEQRLTIKVGGMLIVAVAILLTGLGTTAAVIVNRLPAAAIVPPAHAATAALVLAGERTMSEATPAFDWDMYHDRQDACREADRIAAQCVQGVAFCDELALRQAQRACSAFGPLGRGERP